MPSSLQILPLVASLLGLVLMVIATVLSVVDRGLAVDAPVPEPTEWFVPIQVTSALMWIVASLALIPRRDLNWSRLAAIAALSHAAAAASFAWAVHGFVGGYDAPGASIAAALCLMLLPVEMPVMVYFLVSLPTGRLTRSRFDRLGMAAVVVAAAGVVVSSVSIPDVEGTTFSSAENPLSIGLDNGPIPALFIASAAVIATVVLIMKWRRSVGADRLALRWVVWIQLAGTVLIVPLFAVAPEGIAVGAAQIANAVGLLVLVTVIQRQRMLGIERLLERTLRFVLLLGALTAIYAVVIALVSEFAGASMRPVAAAVVAIAALPLRDRVSKAVARFMYGNRLSSSEIVQGVAEKAASVLGPGDLVEQLLGDLQAGTGAGAISVELSGYGTIASVGSDPDDRPGGLHLPLRNRGAVIGDLTLLPGAGESEIDPLAERVAREVAPHIAIVTEACRADIDLQYARSRLIQAREEERRRLRHDLHDGLGPILTGVAFSADAASNLVVADPDGAVELIAAARRDVTLALDEIRRIVDDLRPPALDELGLFGAIRQHAERFPELAVTVSGSAPSELLSAAVEVAAYRIATEALTNVARHSEAGHALVDVTLNGGLAVTISDDGRGVEEWQPGVGLTSMGDRARELGGDIVAGPGPEGGGLVIASLPVETR